MRLPSQFNPNDNGELHFVGTSPYLQLIHSKVKSTALSVITAFQSTKDKHEAGCGASSRREAQETVEKWKSWQCFLLVLLLVLQDFHYKLALS